MNDRDETIARIRKALKARSGKAWSVTGGKGTSWGWIRVNAPPARRTWFHYLPEGERDYPENYREREEPGRAYGHMSPEEREELAVLLGLERVNPDGVSIPAGSDFRREYIDRAEGRPPSVIGKPYWD